MKEADAIGRVISELQAAQKKHIPMNGAHEGYAVVLEELDELWEEVKELRNVKDRHNICAMRKEASHVSAMALRFMIDVC